MPDNILAAYMTRAELAKQFGIHERTIIRWCNRGEGPAITKLGSRVLFHRAAIAAWLAARQQVSP